MKSRILIAAALLFTGINAAAHEGHSTVSSAHSGIAHYATEPMHLLPIIVAVAVLALFVRRARRQR